MPLTSILWCLLKDGDGTLHEDTRRTGLHSKPNLSSTSVTLSLNDSSSPVAAAGPNLFPANRLSRRRQPLGRGGDSGEDPPESVLPFILRPSEKQKHITLRR